MVAEPVPAPATAASPPAAPSDPAPPPAAPPLAAPSPIEPPVVEPRPVRHFLFGNGLALLMTRLSVGYELFPARHHSIGISVFGQAVGGFASEIMAPGACLGLGTELGYRFYGGHDGPSGPFLGLSVLGGRYLSLSRLYRTDTHGEGYFQLGGAADVGWALHLDRTIVVALGVGVQYTWVAGASRDTLSEIAQLVSGEGFRPRGNVQVGKTF